MAKVTQDEATGRLNVELEPLWKMTEVPSRIAPGHGACPGCGAFPTLHQVDRVLEGDVVVLFQTGCAMVVTTGYPDTAHRINYIHNLFQNGARDAVGPGRDVPRAGAPRRAAEVQGHHLRHGHRRRRHGHRHGRRRSARRTATTA